MKSAQTEYSRQTSASVSTPAVLLKKKKFILIVDDEFSNRLILRNILHQEEYYIHECDNGMEALEFIHRCRPDLILLDVMMPVMNGYEFCTAVKADSETANIPILFITLLADTQQVVKAFELGAADYLTKPFYGEEVLARIRRQLHIKEKSAILEQQSGELEQLVTRKKQELIRAEHHIAYGHLVQGILHNLKNPSIVLSRGVERARNAHIDLTESYELGADLNSDLMKTHIRRIDRALKLVENASERLSGVLASLFHRIHNNQNTNPQLLDINTVIRDEINFLKANPFFSNQVKKEIFLTEKMLPVVAVSSELAQLFNNLLSNSIDALQQLNREAVLSIETRKAGTRAIITISDNGCGINKEDQELIFTPFFTTKKSENNASESLRDFSGTGLGLFMCHSTIQSLRGEITLKSNPEQGTTFYINIPLAIQKGATNNTKRC